MTRCLEHWWAGLGWAPALIITMVVGSALAVVINYYCGRMR